MAVLKRLIIAVLTGLLMAFPATAHAAPANQDKPSFSEHVDECLDFKEDLKNGEGTAMEKIAEWNNNLDDLLKPDWLQNMEQGASKVDCQASSAIGHPVAAIEAAASQFWGDPVGDFTRAVLEGNAEALQTVMTFWTDFKLDNSAVDAAVQGVKNIVFSLAGLALIASLIAGGFRIANDRRRGLVDSMEDTGGVIFKYILFGTLIPPLVVGAVYASDSLADWIMASFGASSAETVLGSAELNETMAGPILMLAFAGVAFAGSVMQIVALAVRTLLLPIAAGMTPLFAALSFSQTGKNALSNLVSLMIASIIFKPVSALLYCVVFWLSGRGGDSLVSLIISVVMIGAAGFTAPALVRALVPAVAQAGGGGAAPVIAGGAAATGAALGMGGSALAAMGGAGAKSQAGSAGTAAGGGGAGGQGPGALGGAGANPSGGPTGGGPTGGGSGGSGGVAGSGGGAAGGQASPSGATQGSGGRSASTGGAAASTAGANPNGSGAANTNQSTSGSHSTASQPMGAGASQNTGARARMGEAGRTAIRHARTASRGASKVAVGGARVAQAAGSTAGRIQGILDEGIGQQGSYHGSVRR